MDKKGKRDKKNEERKEYGKRVSCPGLKLIHEEPKDVVRAMYLS
jgi:hypothetical protein